MKTFCNDQAKPLLKFFTSTKSEIRNLKLKQILEGGFISKPQGIFLKAARRAYNSAVEIYNNATQMFPSNIVASMFGFHKDVFFDIPENEAAAPNVGDLFKK